MLDGMRELLVGVIHEFDVFHLVSRILPRRSGSEVQKTRGVMVRQPEYMAKLMTNNKIIKLATGKGNASTHDPIVDDVPSHNRVETFIFDGLNYPQWKDSRAGNSRGTGINLKADLVLELLSPSVYERSTVGPLFNKPLLEHN